MLNCLAIEACPRLFSFWWGVIFVERNLLAQGRCEFLTHCPGARARLSGIDRQHGLDQSGRQSQRHAEYPNITQDYARTFHDQKEMRIDVWLSSHAAQFDMHKKYKPGDAYDPDRFVNPKGFRASVERLEKIYRDQLAQERQGK
jgi:hypothetical protein